MSDIDHAIYYLETVGLQHDADAVKSQRVMCIDLRARVTELEASLAASKRVIEAKDAQAAIHEKRLLELREARETLDSERQANARLTAELDAALAKREAVADVPGGVREVRYLTDDRDRDPEDQHELIIHLGGNGDWYVSVLPKGHRFGPCVRICTRGGASSAVPGLCHAIANAFRALSESQQAAKDQRNG